MALIDVCYSCGKEIETTERVVTIETTIDAMLDIISSLEDSKEKIKSMKEGDTISISSNNKLVLQFKFLKSNA